MSFHPILRGLDNRVIPLLFHMLSASPFLVYSIVHAVYIFATRTEQRIDSSLSEFGYLVHE